MAGCDVLAVSRRALCRLVQQCLHEDFKPRKQLIRDVRRRSRQRYGVEYLFIAV
jgi:ribosomal protein S9